MLLWRRLISCLILVRQVSMKKRKKNIKTTTIITITMESTTRCGITGSLWHDYVLFKWGLMTLIFSRSGLAWHCLSQWTSVSPLSQSKTFEVKYFVVIYIGAGVDELLARRQLRLLRLQPPHIHKLRHTSSCGGNRRDPRARAPKAAPAPSAHIIFIKWDIYVRFCH